MNVRYQKHMILCVSAIMYGLVFWVLNILYCSYYPVFSCVIQLIVNTTLDKDNKLRSIFHIVGIVHMILRRFLADVVYFSDLYKAMCMRTVWPIVSRCSKWHYNFVFCSTSIMIPTCDLLVTIPWSLTLCSAT